LLRLVIEDGLTRRCRSLGRARPSGARRDRHPRESDPLKETTMMIENMLLGSAGYGGILRSCPGVRNLNVEPNDEDRWLYVQGLNNPRFKPFQLSGIPLRLKVPPGAVRGLRSRQRHRPALDSRGAETRRTEGE
jgi:hypothetical protein